MPIGFEQIGQVEKLVGRAPTDLSHFGRIWRQFALRQLRHPPKESQASISGLKTPNALDWQHRPTDFLAEFSDQSLFLRFARLDRSADKTPSPAGENSGRALDDQKSTLTKDNRNDAFFWIG